MNARWLTLAGLIVVAGAAPAQAQGLLERLGKIAREAGKAVEQPPPGSLPPGAAPGVAPQPGAVPNTVAPLGYLGLTVDEPARGSQGAPVVGVREGSPAADAGFVPGDVVLSVDGAPINSLDDFQAAMTGLHAGDRVRIKFVRQGATQNLSVRLAERPGTAPVVGDPPSGVPFKTPRQPAAGTVTGTRASLGVTVMPLSDEARRRYGLDVARGALVTGVRPGGPAERAGIPAGSAIVALDGKRVDAAEELIDQVSSSRPGQEVEVTFYVRDKLQRKNVVLGASDPGPTRPLDGGLGGVVGDGDRPLLRRLEGVLDNLGGGGRGGVDVDVDATLNRPPAANANASDMRRQIEELQITVERLTKRVKDLEGRLGGGNPEVPPPPPKNDAPPANAPPLVPPKNG